MTRTATTTEPPALPDTYDTLPGRSLWADAFRRLRRNPAAMVCLAIILIYIAVAILAPILIGDYERQADYDNINAAPDADHLLGTDALGRSVLHKTLLSASTSMTVAFAANIIAIPLGMVLGALAGFFGKRVDDFVVWLYSTLASIPGIIRLIAIKVAFQNVVLFEGTSFELSLDGLAGLCIALGVMGWINTCRLVRAETLKLRESDYVMAARAAGRSRIAILFRHVVPNVLHLGIINFSLAFVGVILAEVTLSYLGLGVQDMPSWGKMISSAKMDLVVGRWWELASAVGAMFVIVLAWNVFGDRLRDALDPRLRNV